MTCHITDTLLKDTIGAALNDRIGPSYVFRPDIAGTLLSVVCIGLIDQSTPGRMVGDKQAVSFSNRETKNTRGRLEQWTARSRASYAAAKFLT